MKGNLVSVNSEAALRPASGERVLGVDTSLRNSGLGLVERNGSRLVALWSRTAHVPATKSLSQCLLQLREELKGAIDLYKPDALAIEGIFFCKFANTAMLLGHARGIVVMTAAEVGLPVYEYEPRRVKQAVTGNGNAAKEQVMAMMKAIFRLDSLPPNDEADALALAVCHFNAQTGIAAKAQKPL